MFNNIRKRERGKKLYKSFIVDIKCNMTCPTKLGSIFIISRSQWGTRSAWLQNSVGTDTPRMLQKLFTSMLSSLKGIVYSKFYSARQSKMYMTFFPQHFSLSNSSERRSTQSIFEGPKSTFTQLQRASHDPADEQESSQSFSHFQKKINYMLFNYKCSCPAKHVHKMVK